MGKARLLLIDDDPDFTLATKTLLEAEGYEVLTAADGGAGLKLALSEYPNLVILDVMMNGYTDGIEVSRKIQENQNLRGLPVILLTGIRQALSLSAAPGPDKDWLPVQTVLEKPVPPEILLAEVEKHLPSVA